jgi:tetratricopeptide (TPR) repeat protein
MPRRPSPPSVRRNARKPRRAGAGAGRRVGVIVVAVAAAVTVGMGVIGAGWWWQVSRAARWRGRAEASAQVGDWPAALTAWRAFNATNQAQSATHLAEAKSALALGRAAQAERALERAIAADRSNAEPWRLRLELLRVEDRALEAQAVGWEAYRAVPSRTRRQVLRDLTLAQLADLPDDLARTTLARWAAADPSEPDPDARVALLARMATMPRGDDPDRAARIVELTALLARAPLNLAAREALIVALADAGEPDRGRQVLDAWPGPESSRDARYWRLRGRWDLDYDHRPDRAAEAFARALADLPHDWKTRFRLARALHALGREADARREAEVVGRTREALDPETLGPRLAVDLDRTGDPAALLDLADLCARAGLTRLANAWHVEADAARRAGGR